MSPFPLGIPTVSSKGKKQKKDKGGNASGFTAGPCSGKSAAAWTLANAQGFRASNRQHSSYNTRAPAQRIGNTSSA